MLIRRLDLVFFSPTGTTQRILECAASQFAVERHVWNLTPFSGREALPEVPRDSLLLVGAPVYGGRIPAVFLERLAQLRGEGGPVVPIVTFGCREYDDALLELKNFLEAHGFETAAAGAFATEHNIVREIGAGRPTAEDFAIVERFARQVAEKLGAAELPFPPLAVLGDPAYRDYAPVPLRPHASGSCTKCGVCATECPVGAIPADAPHKTDKKCCICCMRCTRICPQRARALPALEAFAASKMLMSKCRSNKEHQIFL